MANFATSALAKAQAKLINKFKAGEMKFRNPAVHLLFVRETNIMMPDYNTLRTREDRTVETNYLLRTSRALGGARSHNYTGAQGDSAIMTPSWAPYTDGFVSTIKEADNKIYDFTELHMNKMENVLINFVNGLETVASGYAFSNRTGVNSATAGGTFNAVDDTFEITDATNGEKAIQITRTVMDINELSGDDLVVICDSIAWNKFGFDSAQGTGNSTNLGYQFQGIEFIHDPKLTAAAAGLVAAYSKGYWIAVPRGTVAGLDWIPLQNREGRDYGNIASYGTILNPIDGLNYAIHSYQAGADGTAVGGYTQDVKIETQVSIDIAYVNSPSSTANESTLFAFALV